jgi:hypothetical protein
LPNSYGQNRGNFRSFFLKCCISVYIHQKSKTSKKINISAAPPLIIFYHIILLLARLEVVLQSL